MDFLVLSPPVCPPSEPPSGAFILAGALQGHGYETGFLDLSLSFYHSVLLSGGDTAGLKRALRYLQNTFEYTPMEHRSAAGVINRHLKTFGESRPGWRLTAMDLSAPAPIHDPNRIAALLAHDDPFIPLWEETLLPVIRTHAPKQILLSLAYLSQLTAAISLSQFLRSQNLPFTVGGSLPRSLHATGEGYHLLSRFFPRLDVSNGASLLPEMTERAFLQQFAYPRVLSELAYLSGRPVLPFTLSTGCYWSGCLFCPDNEMKYIQLQMEGFQRFAASIPPDVKQKKPIIHLLDSAMPKNRLRAFMPIARENQLPFYGFARPESRFLEDGFIEALATSGCLMLQLGVESGNDALLQRYNKGIHPTVSAQVLQRAAAAGIRTYVYLLFGLPGETDAHREDTRRLIAENIDAVDFLNLSIFNLPKHCALSQRAEAFGIEIHQYDENEDVIELYRPFREPHAEQSPRTASRTFISKRFTSDERIRQAYLRTPKWFRAAHLAMMKLNDRN
ncbi:MAG: radical SAM protein [Deltaproteobacteria bacterium]|nr:radical SAM protein [Deltaproteobacteria bacterium]MBN2674261.1 radical SAM protein [Deltaproteobacteria bacterium]